VVGGFLLLGTGVPYAYVNVVAGLVYAVTMPIVGIATTYVYYDALVRERVAEAAAPPPDLPAEVSL
jgi:hypothetical protein